MPGAPLTANDPHSLHGYQLVRRLGSGGMGVVYLGTDGAGNQVAVKVMRREFADDRSFRARFAREAEAMRAVQGPRTVRVLAVGVDVEEPYLVTEYADGDSLADRVSAHGPLSNAEALRLAEALAEALVSIHSAGIVHRDLKPSNVILAPDGPKVIDFGISQVADGTALTRTGMVIGTPGYLAPEQIDRRGVPGPAIDVFAWALTVAYALTGRPPFGTGPSEAVLFRVLHDAPDLEGIPGTVLPVLHAALRKDPARRPTAGELAGLLADPPPLDTVAPTDLVTRPSPQVPPPTVLAQPHRRRALVPLLVAAVVAAVLAGAAGGFLLLRPDDGDPPGETLTATEVIRVAPWDDATGEPAADTVITGEASGSCWSPSVVLDRPDAWRCSAGNTVHDPCFDGGDGPVLLCNINREALQEMVRLELLEPLPQFDPLPEGSGFFGVLVLVLADGQLCLPTGGATTDVAGERYDYECPDGRGYGEPDTRNPIWILSYRAEGASELVPVEIATAYQ